MLLAGLLGWKHSPSVVVLLSSHPPELGSLRGNIMRPDMRTGLFQVPLTPVCMNDKSSKEPFKQKSVEFRLAHVYLALAVPISCKFDHLPCLF